MMKLITLVFKLERMNIVYSINYILFLFLTNI